MIIYRWHIYPDAQFIWPQLLTFFAKQLFFTQASLYNPPPAHVTA